MEVKPITSLADQVAYEATHLIKVTFADIAAAAATKTVALLTLAAGQMVRNVWVKTKTGFTGGALSAMTLQVGDGSDTDRNLAAGSVFAAGYLSIQPRTTGPSTFAAGDTLDALFTATGANTEAATAGEVWIYVKIIDLNEAEGARG